MNCKHRTRPITYLTNMLVAVMSLGPSDAITDTLQLATSQPSGEPSIGTHVPQQENAKWRCSPPSCKMVHISINSMLSDSTTEYPLETLQDLDQLQANIASFNDDVQMTILAADSGTSINVMLQRNKHLITKGFVRKYYTRAGTPMVKRDDVKDTALSHCYFTGRVLKEKDSSASLSLCGGVKGIVEIGTAAYTIAPLVTADSLRHTWRRANQSRKTDETSKCGVVDKKVHENESIYNFVPPKHRFAREFRAPANSTSDTRYIELYAVMDNSMYRSLGSVDAAILRAVTIVNHANLLYRQLNIYIALVGVEVWNDRDKVSYPLKYGTSVYDGAAMLTPFGEYRQFTINLETNNDAAMLFTNVSIFKNNVGWAKVGSICRQIGNVGLTRDYTEDYLESAATMAHEIGHNLGLSHNDYLPDKSCHMCSATSHCIMHSRQSRK